MHNRPSPSYSYDQAVSERASLMKVMPVSLPALASAQTRTFSSAMRRAAVLVAVKSEACIKIHAPKTDGPCLSSDSPAICPPSRASEVLLELFHPASTGRRQRPLICRTAHDFRRGTEDRSVAERRKRCHFSVGTAEARLKQLPCLLIQTLQLHWTLDLCSELGGMVAVRLRQGAVTTAELHEP